MLKPTGWWLAISPVDLRCGIDRLLIAVQGLTGRDGFDGGAYVFCNRAGNRIKVLCVDGQGVWLCVRRLHHGKFHRPRAGASHCALSQAQFDWLVAGVDWQRLSQRVEGLARAM